MHFLIPDDHPALPGHFPGNPLVPGVVVLDRVVAALEAREGPLPPLRLPQVKFLSPLRPGQAADVALDGGGGRWRFRVTTGDAVVASGELVAMPEGVP